MQQAAPSVQHSTYYAATAGKHLPIIAPGYDAKHLQSDAKKASPVTALPLLPAVQLHRANVTSQDFLSARLRFQANVMRYLAALVASQKQKACEVFKIFVPGSVNIWGDEDKNSASTSVIAMADLKVVPAMRDGVDAKYFTSQYAGFTSVVLKIFLAPTNRTFDNSLEIEATLYKNITSRLITESHTPHLVNYLCSMTCELDRLVLTLADPDRDRARLLNQLSFNGYETWQPEDLSDDLGHLKLGVLICTRAVSSMPKKLNLASLLAINDSRRPDFNPKKERAFSPLTTTDLAQIFFQVLHTLCCFEAIGLRHNDLHFGNIFVEHFPHDKYQFLYRDAHNDLISMQTSWNVQIFDFDRSSIYSESMKRNALLDSQVHCGSCKATVQQIDVATHDLHQQVADLFGLNTCNNQNPCFDVHGFMTVFLNKVSDSAVTMPFKRWIEPLIPQAVRVYNRSADYSQIAYDHYVEQLVQSGQAKLLTPREYMTHFIPFATQFKAIERRPGKSVDERLGWRVPSAPQRQMMQPRRVVEDPEEQTRSITNRVLQPVDIVQSTDHMRHAMVMPLPGAASSSPIGGDTERGKAHIRGRPSQGMRVSAIDLEDMSGAPLQQLPHYEDPEWDRIAKMPLLFHKDPVANATARRVHIERQLQTIAHHPGRRGPNDPFARAEAEMNVDLTIEQYYSPEDHQVVAKCQGLISSWIHEMDLLSPTWSGWSHDKTRRSLFDRYLSRAGGPDMAKALAKVCIIVTAPIMYGLPAFVRSRLLHQLGRDEYELYLWLFRSANMQQQLSGFDIPLLYDYS